MKKAIMCIVPTRSEADSLVGALTSSGFPASAVSVLAPDKWGTRDFGIEKHSKAPEGAVAGVATGGAAGGTVGLLAGLGLLVVPGAGPLLAVGPIMAALVGAAVGASGGGVVGSLVGLGIPEVQAKLYEGKVTAGSILVCAHCETSEQERQASTLFERAGASDISSLYESSVPNDVSPRPNRHRTQLLGVVVCLVTAGGLAACEQVNDDDGKNNRTYNNSAPKSSERLRIEDHMDLVMNGDFADASGQRVAERKADVPAITPMDQGNTEADLQTTKNIRRALLKRDGLSLAAKNITIITADGVVTLKGSVPYAADRNAVVAVAGSAAGLNRVDNQIQVDGMQASVVHQDD